MGPHPVVYRQFLTISFSDAPMMTWGEWPSKRHFHIVETPGRLRCVLEPPKKT